VAALREVSVLFAVVIGTLVLKEDVTIGRVLGAMVIISGIMALRLA
jgi:uncharacterized membrane protein